jgi:hypothetical protein
MMILRLFLLAMLCLSLTACADAASAVEGLQQEVRSRINGESEVQAGTPVDDKTRAAIQLLITRANLQQEQAVASRDPSVMRSTATITHYEEMSRLVRQMQNDGIASIGLLSLEWGPILRNGDTITATTFETWTQTGTDKRTDQFTDRNVYTIIQEGGGWRIDMTDHPDSSAPRPARTPSVAPSRSPTPVPSTTPSAGDETASPDELAIRDVIQRANDAQVLAYMSNEPTGMRDTATQSYYQEMMRINQGMRQNRILAIALESLEWGPISVTGTTATAETYESWATTLPDGSVNRARDRNIYRLVQQNGTWRISGNDHPDQLPVLTPGRTV